MASCTAHVRFLRHTLKVYEGCSATQHKFPVKRPFKKATGGISAPIAQAATEDECYETPIRLIVVIAPSFAKGR